MSSLRYSHVVVYAVLAFLVAGCGQEAPVYKGPALPYTPDAPKAKEPNPRVALETSAGRIELELFEDDAPNTVANFISLIEKKFYDGTKFHRIVKDFMVQGGDPQGNSRGGPGYKFPDELKNHVNKLEKYSLAMAHPDQKDSNGSQFFIMTGPKPKPQRADQDLDKKHTVFGKVVAGFDVVDKLNLTPVDGEKPKQEVKLVSATVLAKRTHPYEVRGKLPDAAAGKQTPFKFDPKDFKLTPGPATKVEMKKPVETKPAETKTATPPASETKADAKTPDEKKSEPAKAEEKK
jgi:peptidyl-prolyl cis-trans isomerase B (cyclophilin B)